MKENNDNINLVWTGILLVVLLIILVRPLIMQENTFRRVEGEIAISHMGSNYYRIRLNTARTVYTARSHIDILQEKAVVGKEAVIWYSRPLPSRSARAENSIQKMVVDNEVVIPFRRAIGIRLIFIGVFLTSLIAIIIHFAKKRRKRVSEIENI